MHLTFCPLFSGSSGNSLYISGGDTRLLIDAGMPGKKIEGALNSLGVEAGQLNGILVTHEHSDHIAGVGVLSRRHNLPVYANTATWQAMCSKLGLVAPENRRLFETGEDFFIRDLGILPFAIPHDAADPVGYSIHYLGKKIAIATDIGHISADWMQAVSGAHVLMLEANHDLKMLSQSRYPSYLKKRISGRKGHLSNVDTGKALAHLVKSGITHCILGHLSHENNLPELAYQTVCEALNGAGIHAGSDCGLELAYRDRPSTCYTIT